MKYILFLYKYILNIFQKAVEEPLNGMWLLQTYIFLHLLPDHNLNWSPNQLEYSVCVLGRI